MVFSEYPDFYDLYYADKDYAAETDFVLNLAYRFGGKSQNLLDMGCGTGRHLEEFVKRGLNVKCEFPLPVQYEGIKIEDGFRADMIVDDAVIIENKTVDKIAPIYPVK